MRKKNVFRLGIFGSLCAATFAGVAFNVHAASNITVSSVGSYSEGAGVTFSLSDTTATPSVYYSVANQNSWTEIDSELIREATTGYRADILGLSAGTYDIKISDGSISKTISDITVSAYDRSGYAHFDYTSDGTSIDVSEGIGAYNNDGTLKDGAYVVYVSDATKNTVTLTAGSKTYTGIVNILNSGVTPLDVRILDTITTDTWTQIDYKNNINVNEYSSVSNPDSSNTKYHQITIGNSNGSATISNDEKTYTQAELISAGYNTLQGKYESIDNLTSYMTTDTEKKNNITYNDFDSYWNMCNITSANGVTVEGVGENAGLFQWGFTWAKCSSIEVRNLTFDDYPEDACSFQANDTSVSAMSDFSTGHLWVHQNTFKEGMNYWDVSYEQDKHEGDGATDFKGLAFVTVAYNHYINNHKTGLVGGSDEQSTASLTFHHNYYEECQARLPFARQANMHMYNNYYYGTTGNNMQIYAGAYAFIENCYFEDITKTFVFADSSSIGTPAVKSYNNAFDNCSNYDGATLVTDRTTEVSNGNKFGSTFDTDSTLFYYDTTNQVSNVTRLDATADVPTVVPQLAGAGVVLSTSYTDNDAALTIGTSTGTYTSGTDTYGAYRIIGKLTNVDSAYIEDATITISIDAETKDGIQTNKNYTVTTLYESLTENGTVICAAEEGTYYFYFNIYGLTSAYNYYGFTVTANVSINSQSLDETADVYEIYMTDATETTMTLGMNAITTGTASAAGNGEYINSKVKTLYEVGDAIDLSNLTITVEGSVIDVDSSYLTVRGFDTTTTGTKSVTIVYDDGTYYAKLSYDISVVDATLQTATIDSAEVALVYVSDDYTGTIGAATSVTYLNTQYSANGFNTIWQALQFLNNQSGLSETRKYILVEAGTYYEKLELNLPYLSIVGLGSSRDDVIIEWDSLYGEDDESGYTHTTDSTSTVAIRDEAYGLILENITISNYWNSLTRFNNGTGINITLGSSFDHRALAIINMADQVIMDNVKLLGYQDTANFYTGRTYITDSYISGVTDYIFGTNATVYITNSTIHTITSGSTTNGGYITAMKGLNKSSSDAITYGVIFNGCTFEADSSVTDGTVAIGRPWGLYAAVAVVNSTIGACISTEAYTSGTTAAQRYVAMSGNEPTESTVKYVEYGNTGDGAIIASQSGVTYLDSTTAANYSALSVVFAKTNGGVTYSEAWDPTNTTIETDTKTYYYFDGTTGETGTSYTYTDTNSGTTTFGDLTITINSGKLNYRTGNGDTQWNATTVISMPVDAGTSLTVNTYSGTYNYSMYTSSDPTVYYANSSTIEWYFESATTVYFTAHSTVYLHSIVYNPDAEAPSAATLSSISVTNTPTEEIAIGTALDISDIIVYAYYSDNTYKAVTDYTTDTSAVNTTAAGEYTVTVSYGGYSTSFTVTYVTELSTSISASTSVTYKGGSYSASSGSTLYNHNDSSVSLTTTETTVNLITYTNCESNGTNNWLYLYSGATITFDVEAGATLYLYFYNGTNFVSVDLDGTTISTSTAATSSQNTAYAYVISADGTVTITATVSGYLGFMEILF